jgi:hypothetical protein
MLILDDDKLIVLSNTAQKKKQASTGFTAMRLFANSERLKSLPQSFHSLLIGEDYLWHEITGELSGGVLIQCLAQNQDKMSNFRSRHGGGIFPVTPLFSPSLFCTGFELPVAGPILMRGGGTIRRLYAPERMRSDSESDR